MGVAPTKCAGSLFTSVAYCLSQALIECSLRFMIGHDTSLFVRYHLSIEESNKYQIHIASQVICTVHFLNEEE